ncbi:MAG: conserved membrane protein of unknown function [Candidatus Thorarchaeota archaeon]|nr:MAG: conserved membrane protein of unknown function [Candidatus Thorarchaeota archaeon]
MDIFIWILVTVGTAVLMLFNYYLNKAPGADPDDYIVGPPELGITCDCFINVLILGGIAVIAISINSAAFDSRLELYLVGIASFLAITVAGIYGRRERHREWKELRKTFQRAIPEAHTRTYGRPTFEIYFDDEYLEEEEDEDDDSDWGYGP